MELWKDKIDLTIMDNLIRLPDFKTKLTNDNRPSKIQYISKSNGDSRRSHHLYFRICV